MVHDEDVLLVIPERHRLGLDDPDEASVVRADTAQKGIESRSVLLASIVLAIAKAYSSFVPI